MQLSYAAQINKFINILMKRGKRDKAINILNKALYFIKTKTKKNPYYILRKALLNAIPVIAYVVKIKGTASINIPAHLKQPKGVFVAISFIINSANKRFSSSSKPKLKHNVSLRLCDELIDVSNGIGFAVREKRNIYDVVLRNRSKISSNTFKGKQKNPFYYLLNKNKKEFKRPNRHEK